MKNKATKNQEVTTKELTSFQYFGYEGWNKEDYLPVYEGYLVAQYEKDGYLTIKYQDVPDRIYYRVKADRLYMSSLGGIGIMIERKDVKEWILFTLLGEEITVEYQPLKDQVVVRVKEIREA